ncbi:hypothetical protein [Streptomyces sp. NPDC017991]|uniref:hypothetical protein n=1 Tax=Streptomyces sp. NPDC017991 TaxID=3365026 RepID=UPI00379349FB
MTFQAPLADLLVRRQVLRGYPCARCSGGDGRSVQGSVGLGRLRVLSITPVAVGRSCWPTASGSSGPGEFDEGPRRAAKDTLHAVGDVFVPTLPEWLDDVREGFGVRGRQSLLNEFRDVTLDGQGPDESRRCVPQSMKARRTDP